jgi:phosphorylcholine metabolism protein LicD
VVYGDTYFKNYRIDSTFQYKFSSKESFQLIRFNNKLKMRGPWAFWLDLILINTNSAAQGSMEVYKSQDQVWLGVSYDL